jgi:hypothetical protein
VIPVPLISLGTSKLYHYFYPYLPPLALAAGYGVGWLFGLASRVIGRRLGTAPPGQARRWVFDVLTALALAVALLTLIEPIRIQFDGRTIFSNHSVVRPLLAALVFAALAGWGRLAVAAAAVLSASLLIPSPLDGYTASLQRLGERRHPLRSLGACLREADRARRARGEVVLEPYTPVYDSFLHPYFYYLRGSEWLREPDYETLYSGLFSARVRPVVMDANDYAEFLARPDLPPQLPRGISRPGIVVLLPGDYAECRFAEGVWTQ